MKYLIALALLFSFTVAKSQSLFSNLMSTLPDSIHSWNGPRVVGPAAVTGYSPYTKSFSALTGVGIAYTWQTLSNDSSSWYVNTAVGAMIYGGGAQVPNNIAGVVAAGPYFSILNGYISGGIAYNFTNLQPPVAQGAAPPPPPNFGQRLLYTFGVVFPLFR